MTVTDYFGDNMKSYRKELWFNIPARMDFKNITHDVTECLRESGIKEGLALINAMHISASVFINDDERGLHHDYKVPVLQRRPPSVWLARAVTSQRRSE